MPTAPPSILDFAGLPGFLSPENKAIFTKLAAARHYRPRMLAVLSFVPKGPSSLFGEVVRLPVRVRRAVIVSNDHNHADELRLQVEWADAGVDPRFLASASVEFYMGQEAEFNAGNPPDSLLRFAGIMVRPSRVSREDGSLVVDLEFLDYTTLFLEVREYATKGQPDLSMTLSEAWRLICDNTGSPNPETGEFSSTVSRLRDRIVFLGGTPDAVLGTAAAPRFASIGAKLPPINAGRTDSWAVWQQCVGMLGLISYIYKDQVVVTTSENLYTVNDPPVLVWGRNILSISESRNVLRGGRAIGIQSFDPLTARTIEAVYPPPGNPAVFKKKIPAKKIGDENAIRQAADIEYFEYYGVTNQDILNAIAKRAWEERSRQEFEGCARTCEMVCSRLSGAPFDLLSLTAGNVIRIESDPGLREFFYTNPGIPARVTYLKARGYSDDIAQIMAQGMDDVLRLNPDFYIRRVETLLDYTPDGGTFEMTVNYCNRIDISGDAIAP